MEKTLTIAELLRFVEREYHNENAFNEKGPQGWISMSHQEFLDKVKAIACYLHSTGIKKGDVVGIVALPCIQWVIADLAIMACGAITVPLFANISEENFVYECKQTNLKTLFISGSEPWIMYEKHKTMFEKVIALETPPYMENNFFLYENVLAQGQTTCKNHPHLFNELLDGIDENEIAKLSTQADLQEFLKVLF